MKYSLEFKEMLVQKVLTGRNVRELASEVGISQYCIYEWVRMKRNGILLDRSKGPRDLLLQDKQKLLLESKTISEDCLGEWLRKKSVHSDHLIKWETEIADAMDKNSKEKQEIKRLLEENKLLKKEIARKDRALSEAAVLLTLKKKYKHLWEDEEK